MGKVRTKTIKKSSRRIIERYYPRLTLDFHTNKRICDDIAEIPTKRMRNKIAGYVTRLMKRIQRGAVKGISIKLQEEEREKRDNYAPEAILWCSIGSCMIGLILLVVGAIVTGIAFSEITPPDYDKLYDRYTGANIRRVTGILALTFGFIIMISSCAFFVWAFISERNEHEHGRKSKQNYSSRQAMANPAEV